MLLEENAVMLHRFDRTNQKRANQRYLEYDLWDLILQIANQSCVRLVAILSVTNGTISIEWIRIKTPYIKLCAAW